MKTFVFKTCSCGLHCLLRLRMSCVSSFLGSQSSLNAFSPGIWWSCWVLWFWDWVNCGEMAHLKQFNKESHVCNNLFIGRNWRISNAPLLWIHGCQLKAWSVKWSTLHTLWNGLLFSSLIVLLKLQAFDSSLLILNWLCFDSKIICNSQHWKKLCVIEWVSIWSSLRVWSSLLRVVLHSASTLVCCLVQQLQQLLWINFHRRIWKVGFSGYNLRPFAFEWFAHGHGQIRSVETGKQRGQHAKYNLSSFANLKVKDGFDCCAPCPYKTRPHQDPNWQKTMAAAVSIFLLFVLLPATTRLWNYLLTSLWMIPTFSRRDANGTCRTHAKASQNTTFNFIL